jgi:hypothetical protein
MCTLAYLCFAWWVRVSVAFFPSMYVRKLSSLACVPIRHMNEPICTGCIHFISYNKTDPYDFYENDDRGKCARFGTKNLVTGDIQHEYARVCRNDAKRCGVRGAYYRGWDEIGHCDL